MSVTGHSFDSNHRLIFTCVYSELLCAGYTGSSIMGRLMINRISLWVSGCSILSKWAFHLARVSVPLWVSGRSTWGCGCSTLSKWVFHFYLSKWMSGFFKLTDQVNTNGILLGAQITWPSTVPEKCERIHQIWRIEIRKL